MARWRVWLKCIGQAVVQKGLRALLGQVPFGEVIYAVGAGACELVKKEEQREEDRRILLQDMLQASEQQIRQAAEEAAQNAAAGLSAEVQERLAIYLMQVPNVARQSLRRPDDPTGTTVPPGRSLSRPDDLVPLLPTRTPRFKVGDRPLSGVDWELEQLLGVGGFGEVWKARNPHFDGVAHAALKFCLDPEAKERLLGHEAAVLNQVMHQKMPNGQPHPGIVALRHTYLSADPPCLEYEYVSGGDLATLIQKWHQKRSADLVQRVLRAMTGLTKIIAFAHQLNPPIVHRDLKPANILLQPLADGKGSSLRVADFGIGGVAAQQALAETKSGTTPHGHILSSSMLGSYTPLYASPQQMHGGPPDPRDDVHALGVIWLQMLTGDLTQGVVAEWREELAEMKVPETMLQVLAKCLASKPEKRLANAAALLESLNLVGQTFQSADAPVKQPLAPADPPPVAHAPSSPVTDPKPQGDLARTLEQPLSPVPPPTYPKPGAIWTNSLGMTFAWIPPGTFVMGSDPSEEGSKVDELRHEVTLTKGFYMGIYPVTEAEWRKVMGDAPGATQRDKYPMVPTTWNDCQTFCKRLGQKLSRKDGDISYRLPTEAEWEYACRAGSTTAYCSGDDVEALKEVGWCCYDGQQQGSSKEAKPVGSFKPNAWGLVDMHGNVCEWCADYYGPYPGKDAKDPQGPNYQTNAQKTLAHRVLRGGSWLDGPNQCRSAFRHSASMLPMLPQHFPSSVAYGCRVCFFPVSEQPPTTSPVAFEPGSDLGSLKQPDDGGNSPVAPEFADIQGDERDYLKAFNLGKNKEFLQSCAPGRIARWQAAAEKALPAAQFLYGECLTYGTGVAANPQQASSWLELAAKNAHAAAQYCLGIKYQNGQGVPRDQAQAAQWYRRSAEQGFGGAQNNLGHLYLNGHGVAKDYTQAEQWFRKAITQGNAGALNNLGMMYYSGWGVPKDDVQAADLIFRIAETITSVPECTITIS